MGGERQRHYLREVMVRTELTQRLSEALTLRVAHNVGRTRQERVPSHRPRSLAVEVDGDNIAPRLRRKENLTRTGEHRLRHLQARVTMG